MLAEMRLIFEMFRTQGHGNVVGGITRATPDGGACAEPALRRCSIIGRDGFALQAEVTSVTRPARTIIQDLSPGWLFIAKYAYFPMFCPMVPAADAVAGHRQHLALRTKREPLAAFSFRTRMRAARQGARLSAMVTLLPRIEAPHAKP